MAKSFRRAKKFSDFSAILQTKYFLLHYFITLICFEHIYNYFYMRHLFIIHGKILFAIKKLA